MYGYAPERLELYHENTGRVITEFNGPDDYWREKVFTFFSSDGTRIIPFGIIRHPLLQLPPPQNG
jgi:hypothetical protein